MIKGQDELFGGGAEQNADREDPFQQVAHDRPAKARAAARPGPPVPVPGQEGGSNRVLRGRLCSGLNGQPDDDFLSKPLNQPELLARVRSLLRIKELYDTVQAQARQLTELNQTLEQRVADQVGQLDRLARLRRFFSPHLADLIVAGDAADPLKSHRREVTVVFVDLRGFTAFAETSEPEEVMGVLREYHAEMGAHILAYEGTLERFTGDGLMIFFNDPVPVLDPADRALRMAVAMCDGVGALTIRWQRRGYDLSAGIGVAQGYATIGAIGFEGRLDYGAIGTVTNLAARLCGEARAGQILVSQRLLGTVEHLVEVAPVGELTLKGFLRPVTAFNVLRLRDGVPTSRPTHDLG